MSSPAARPAASPTRREVLVGSLAFSSLLLAPRWLRADPAPSAARRAIVFLHLRGGNDGLNTVVPVEQAAYRHLRPSLALSPAACHPLSKDAALHPALDALFDLWRRDRLAVINGVGYPQPNLSHFRSTEIWHTARTERTAGEGWLGRAFRQRGPSGGVDAVAFDRQPPQSFSGGERSALTLRRFRDLRLPGDLSDVALLYRAYADLPAARGVVGRAGRDALAIARRIAGLKPVTGNFQGRSGEDLRHALALLDARLGVDVLHLALDGFDTHANQADAHARLLAELGRNLRAFQDGLEARGLGREVVTVVFSEFGRRPAENRSGGTDHGTAGPVLVLGDGVKAGLHGAQPDLEDLEDGNPRFTIDFRRLYAALLGDALGISPSSLLGPHEPLELFA